MVLYMLLWTCFLFCLVAFVGPNSGALHFGLPSDRLKKDHPTVLPCTYMHACLARQNPTFHPPRLSLAAPLRRSTNNHASVSPQLPHRSANTFVPMAATNTPALVLQNLTPTKLRVKAAASNMLKSPMTKVTLFVLRTAMPASAA